MKACQLDVNGGFGMQASAPIDRVMAPRFKAKSSYTDDFQTSQAGPKERRADAAEDIKAADTTLDLHQGTSRATHHLPGRLALADKVLA